MTARPAPTSAKRTLGTISTVLTYAMHASCALVFVVPITRTALLIAVVAYVVRMWAITMGYHRYFAHRTFKTSRVFQFILGWLGCSAMQNGPLWWSSWHRRHHRFSDEPGDAHSPVQGGFWHAHMGWFIDGSHDDPDLSNVQDLARYPELRFLERMKWLPLVTHAGLCFLIGGWSGLIWGFFVSTILVLHATMLINSMAHVFGTRRFETKDASRNNPILAILTLGEGWHNNHHHEMTSARQGFVWWELDVSYYVLCVLEWLGVVWDVRTHATIAARRRAAAGAVGALEHIDSSEAASDSV